MALKHPNVFWDWDGTLSNTLPLYFKVFQHTHERFGLPPLTQEEFLLNNGTTTVKHFTARLPEPHAAEAIVHIYATLKEWAHDITLFP